MSLSVKIVLGAIGQELFPVIQKLYQIYRHPYIEEVVDLAEDRIQVEERVLLTQINGIEVWARAFFILQPWSFYPAVLSFELILEPGAKKTRIEARIQWDVDQGPRDFYGSRIGDPRILAAFRRLGQDLVQKLLTRIQERRGRAEASPEFQEALKELEALVALWGEESK